MDSLMQSFGNILPTIFHSMSMSFSNSILFFVFFSVNTVRHAKAFRSFSASFSLVLYKIYLLSPLALLLKVLSYTRLCLDHPPECKLDFRLLRSHLRSTRINDFKSYPDIWRPPLFLQP